MQRSKSKTFETVYTQNHAMVLQMCLGFVKGDIDTANDLSQEVFVNIWNNLDSFKGASTYKTWIYRITVNTCLQYVKKEKKMRTFQLPELENQIDTQEAEVSENTNFAKLYKAIGQLKKVDRLIIMMVLEDQDYEHISTIIGIKPTNVRVKIHRIKKRLETILKNSKDE